MALQFSATKRCALRGLLWWIALATTSLPVPVSPVTRIVLAERATVSSIWNSDCIARLRPRMPPN